MLNDYELSKNYINNLTTLLEEWNSTFNNVSSSSSTDKKISSLKLYLHALQSCAARTKISAKKVEKYKKNKCCGIFLGFLSKTFGTLAKATQNLANIQKAIDELEFSINTLETVEKSKLPSTHPADSNVLSENIDLNIKKEPRKKYLRLENLEQQGILFKYTPFDQGALIENLDKSWKGSCNILSHSWMYCKTRAQDFSAPTSYEITDSHLPHPMIVGENLGKSDDEGSIDVARIQAQFGKSDDEESIDIARIQAQFEKSSYLHKHISKYEVEAQTKSKGIDALLQYMGTYDNYCALMTTRVLFSDFQDQFGHACAFVKRGDQCSWYDPNYGEVTFQKFEDFSKWFKLEVMDGTLTHVLQEALEEKRRLSNDGKVFVSDLYPQPKFSNSEKNFSHVSRSIVEKRNRAMIEGESLEVNLLSHYELDIYIPEKGSSPLPEIDDIPFM